MARTRDIAETGKKENFAEKPGGRENRDPKRTTNGRENRGENETIIHRVPGRLCTDNGPLACMFNSARA